MKRLRVTCRQCGKTVSDTDVSCPSCGRKLDVPPTMLAPNTSRKELDAFVGYLRGALVLTIFIVVVLGGWWLIVFVTKWMWRHS
jgi:hypothetical protein